MRGSIGPSNWQVVLFALLVALCSRLMTGVCIKESTRTAFETVSEWRDVKRVALAFAATRVYANY